jgi:Methyltransferase domain
LKPTASLQLLKPRPRRPHGCSSTQASTYLSRPARAVTAAAMRAVRRLPPRKQLVGGLALASALVIALLYANRQVRVRSAAASRPPALVVDAACALSMAESLGFFCETDESWARRKVIAARQHRRQVRRDDYFSNAMGRWWQNNYEPTFSCAYEQRLGRTGDGGKWGMCGGFWFCPLQLVFASLALD